MNRGESGFARRDLLRLLPTGLAVSAARGGQHCSETATAAPPATHSPYQYRFFTADEAQLVDALMEKIVPADEHSPGAHAARVAEFADLMISSEPDYIKQDWRNGLRLVAEEIKTGGSIDSWLDNVSKREADPQTVAEIFFRDLKHMTINGYYTSAVGIHQDMQYQGNTYVAEFHGCDHPAHKA